jgi:hypothetical protein
MEIPESITNQLNFLKTEIGKAILSTSVDRTSYRRKAVRLYMSTSLLAAFTTLILGLNLHSLHFWWGYDLNLEIWSKRIGLFFTAFITVINAYEVFYNNKELWVSNTQSGNKLHALKFDIEFNEQDTAKLTLEQLGKWKDTYQSILDERNSTWGKFRGNKP